MYREIPLLLWHNGLRPKKSFDYAASGPYRFRAVDLYRGIYQRLEFSSFLPFLRSAGSL